METEFNDCEVVVLTYNPYISADGIFGSQDLYNLLFNRPVLSEHINQPGETN